MWLTLKLHGGFNKEFKQLLGFLQNTQVIQTMANLVPQIAEILVKISF